ncbi:MAG: hypothetical protein HN849_16170 [Victivallales bacterium]|jgi:hypothetical protein|nr:hypothetical protein [Victivallales bacterium]MBT7301057.1 hypothetical protein [Victivallales bacterium]
MSPKLPCCAHCGRAFVPNRYNAHHQKYCTHGDCVRDRKRLRQRKWGASKRASDAEFRARENARCAAANQRRRTAAKACRDPAGTVVGQVAVADVLTGLLSQLADTTDPVLLRASMAAYAARGQRLAFPRLTGTGPP